MSVVGYTRVSTKEQKLGLQAQAQQIRAYCQVNNLDAPVILVEHGVSGGTYLSQRPEGKKLLSMIDSGSVEHVIFTKLDRAFRSAADCLLTVEDLNQKGVAMHFLNLGGASIDTSSPIGKLMITVLGAVGELERGMISERVRDALAEKKRRGEKLGRPTNDCPDLVAFISKCRKEGLSWVKVQKKVEKAGYTNSKGNPYQKTQLVRIHKRSNDNE